LIKSVPPLQDVASMAGVQLPEYLGKMVDEKKVEAPVKESDEVDS